MSDESDAMKDNVIIFPSDPKSLLETSEDGKSSVITIQDPGQPEKTYKIDMQIPEEKVQYFNVEYRNILGKIVSVISRSYDGYNYYVDYDLAVIIEFYKTGNHFIAKQLFPLHFINEDGFKVQVMSEKEILKDD